MKRSQFTKPLSFFSNP
uniref:Uncharacterized protein n=1 Tax=Anguilla anguilla TaxID=7936 RepID=A0A0E9S957_ANGAN